MTLGEKNKDGLVRRMVDSKAWMHVDNKWPKFGVDPRNI
jgi:hypothetical protein